jgi:hypothetical protein
MIADRKQVEDHLQSLHETMSIFSPTDNYNPAITEILKSSDMTEGTPESIR